MAVFGRSSGVATSALPIEARINLPEALIQQIGRSMPLALWPWALAFHVPTSAAGAWTPGGKRFDSDNSGGIEFDEFIQMTAEWLRPYEAEKYEKYLRPAS